MPGLWQLNGDLGKFLVLRRDGTIPEWPWFVLGAADPAAPAALRAYAAACNNYTLSADLDYIRDLGLLADQFEIWRREHPEVRSDPAAARHRPDHPAVIGALMMREGRR